MNVKTMLPALSTLAAALLCLCLGMGGCATGKPGTGGGTAGPAPGANTVPARPAPNKIRIGCDNGLIGRLEEPATVLATIYRAGSETGEKTLVELRPGIWLVPGAAIAMPIADTKGGTEHDM